MKFKKFLTKRNIIIFSIILLIFIIGFTFIYFKNSEQIKNKKIVKSDGEILMINPKLGIEDISCKVISNTEDIVKLTVYNASNLCEEVYFVGSIKDKATIEKGEDNLEFVRVAKNTQYTINNKYQKGVNTIFFFNEYKEYISSTNDNTFITPNNAKYMKVISDFDGKIEEGFNIEYCMVLGDKAGENFGNVTKSNISIDVSNPNNVYFPMEDEELVIYVDGGEIELSYVEK